MKRQIEELEADWQASEYPYDVEPEPDNYEINELDSNPSECESNDSCEDHGNSGDVHIMDWD